jgi:hypothetical protein
MSFGFNLPFESGPALQMLRTIVVVFNFYKRFITKQRLNYEAPVFTDGWPSVHSATCKFICAGAQQRYTTQPNDNYFFPCS